MIIEAVVAGTGTVKLGQKEAISKMLHRQFDHQRIVSTWSEVVVIDMCIDS